MLGTRLPLFLRAIYVFSLEFTTREEPWIKGRLSYAALSIIFFDPDDLHNCYLITNGRAP